MDKEGDRMNRTMMKSKIHRATVTETNLNYVGSITIDSNLMDSADIMENEQVHVINLNNGERAITYAIEGEIGSGVMRLNGAMSRLAEPGDRIIVISFADFTLQEINRYYDKELDVDLRYPRVLHITDDKNNFTIQEKE